MSSQISVRATRRFTLNDTNYQRGDIFALPPNQFDDHGPDGTGLVEAYSPPAPDEAAAKPPRTKKEQKA